MTPPSPAGRLFLVATPIGNLGDMTLRALQVLQETRLIACEDTRTAGRLLAHFEITDRRLVSLFEHNEERRLGQLLEHLERGEDVAVISEAGTPTVSDPGYRLVAACAERGLTVVPIPGPCAAVAALSASGLPTDRFLFLGFPPHKGSKLNRFLEQALEAERTAICYVPARRLPGLLGKVAQRIPETRVVVARELTKMYEEFIRGSAAELVERLESITLKGECTVLFYVPKGARETRA